MNTPVLGEGGEVRYIIHRVEDITELMLAKERYGATRIEAMEAEVLQRAREVKEINRQLKRANESLRESEERLTADLAANQRLQRVSAELIREQTLEDLYRKIVDAASILMRSDYASLQLLHPERGEGGELQLLASHGFTPQATRFWAWVRAESGSTCAMALRTGKRSIAVDVETCDFMAGTEDRTIYLQAGIRAVQSTPLFSRSGRLLGMMSTHWREPFEPPESHLQRFDVLARQTADLIERDRVDRALALRTAQFERLFEAAPLGVYLVDAELRVREVNPIARAAFGDMPDLIGRDFDEVIHVLWLKPYADETAGLFRHTLETGEPYITRERIEERRDRGIVEYYEWQIHRIPLPDGSYGVVCYFRDISAHVLARRALEAADRQKDEFLAMLAHELRNPLAPIRNANEILSRMLPLDDGARAAVDMIKRQAAQLTRLVDDLLDVSRITQGRIQLKCRPIELAGIISQAIETIEPQLRAKQHKLSSFASSYEPLFVNGDAARLVQCVANILSNAVKYTEPGGEIGIRSRAEGERAVIEIADSGVGIAPELLPKVFDLFVQSERTLDRAQGGLGIGLAIVKRLMLMHDGEVVARSPGVGGGSTFELTLPRIGRPQTLDTEAAPVQVTPQRVLIVDDNHDAADSLAMLLRLQGHETRAVYSGQAALECIDSFEPDVALLDLGLPGMDGYALAEWLRAIPHLEGIRLIALTGYGQTEDRHRTEVAGFDDHLVKPVDLGALERALAGAAGGDRERG